MQKPLTPYKEFVISTLEYLLKNKLFRDNYKKVGFSKIIQELVRQYPEINNEGKKTWQKIDLYKKHHKWSIEATCLLNQNPKLSHAELHYEHIVPVSVIIARLMNLNIPDKKTITEVLQDAEVVIITKEQRKIIDSGMKAKGTKSEREKFINLKYDEAYILNTI